MLNRILNVLTVVTCLIILTAPNTGSADAAPTAATVVQATGNGGALAMTTQFSSGGAGGALT